MNVSTTLKFSNSLGSLAVFLLLVAGFIHPLLLSTDIFPSTLDVVTVATAARFYCYSRLVVIAMDSLI